MHKAEFVKQIQELLEIEDKKTAEFVARTVLGRLSHKLSKKEAEDVAAQLAADMIRIWNADNWFTNYMSISGHRHSLKIRRVAEFLSIVRNEFDKNGIDIGAEQATGVVFSLLKSQISQGECEHIGAQLGDELKQLFLAA